MKSINLIHMRMVLILIGLALPVSQGMTSNCEKHPRPGCPDTITVNNAFFEENISSAIALGSVIPDLLPEIGNSRVDLAISNYGDANAIGATFMHAWDSFGFYEKSNIGASFAKGDGDEGKWLFRIQGGVEW